MFYRIDSRKYNAIFDRINYLISEEIMFIILIKSVVNNDKNNYCYNIFIEKGSYKESDTLHF